MSEMKERTRHGELSIADDPDLGARVIRTQT